MAIVPLRMDAPRALKLIREAAQDTGRVIFVAHAKQRMRQRGIGLPQVLSCLRQGRIVEGPALDIPRRVALHVVPASCRR